LGVNVSRRGSQNEAGCLGVFVIDLIVLFVGHHKIFYPLGDGVVLVHNPHLERTELWMAECPSPLNLSIVFEERETNALLWQE